MFIIIFTIIILALVTTKLNAAPQPTDIVLNDIVPPNILKAMRISDEDKAYDHNVSDTNDDVDDEETKRTCATRAFVALLNLADDFNKKATSQGSHLQMRLNSTDDTDTITISYEDPDSSQ